MRNKEKHTVLAVMNCWSSKILKRIVYIYPGLLVAQNMLVDILILAVLLFYALVRFLLRPCLSSRNSQEETLSGLHSGCYCYSVLAGRIYARHEPSSSPPLTALLLYCIWVVSDSNDAA
jgi:uncharacterized membrane protein